MTELRTERLLLRPARESDLDALFALLSDPQVMRYGASAPHTTLNQSREWLTAMIASQPPVGEDFVVEYEGRVVGKAGLWKFPELGFMFIPSVWGRGIATEALRPILSRALTHHRLPAVIADVDPRNSASLHVLTRLGFRETGRATKTWLLGDEWCDSVYLELTDTVAL